MTRGHKSRAVDQENRPDSKASSVRKGSTTTTETRTERRTVEERLIKRTRSPLKPAEGNASNGRKSRDAPERPQKAERVRREEAGSQAQKGQYVRYVESYNPLDEKSRYVGPTFKIAHGLDPSLRDLASGMLKTATHFTALEVFVETMGREECGTVNHALCAAMRKLLKDYLILIAQLEHQAFTNDGFTLHQMNLHLKPTGHMMTQLYSLAQEVLKENSMLGDLLEDDVDQTDEFENILESLREGRDTSIPGKKTCKGGAVLPSPNPTTRSQQAIYADAERMASSR
ncbi:hypothetical protein B0A55_11159 [Friedmanniomyces simplex]|uniref:Spindle pole body component n=1 Tax=Friedmanniomyces simplex TaxID=329884 RepID=A0A4U0W7F6_9PEZI|nr:hypothetical protein B0A55_11159 [Friedmanniomyces simplex]